MKLSLRALASSSFVAAAIAFTSTSAHAQQAPDAQPQFGDAGQVALSINQDVIHSAEDLGLGTGVQLSYFVAPHVSLGLDAGFAWASSTTTPGAAGSSGVSLRLGPRIGYDIPLSSVVSFWPQVGIDYRHYDESYSSDTSVSTVGGVSSVSTTSITDTTNAIAFVAVAPIVIHPVKGFFIGAGPSFSTDLMSTTSASGSDPSIDNPKQTSLGLMALIGGAF